MINIVKRNFQDYNKIYVISDLHGSLELLNNAIDKMKLTKDDLLIIAGDSCDRGKNTPQIYETIIGMQENGYNIIHLLGNHEDMFYEYITTQDNAFVWYFCGGEATLVSYRDNIEFLAKHLKFIEEMPLAVEIGDYIVLHAGINPELSLEEQKREDVLWIREQFIRKKINKIDKTIVFGHTPNLDGRIHFYRNHTISIDCGSYFNHKLGILELKAKKKSYVKI